MNKKLIPAVLFALVAFTSCDNSATNANQGIAPTPNSTVSTEASAATTGPAKAVSFNITGGINPETWKGGETASITFDEFPQNVESFKLTQETLGKTPEGAVLLELMAFEICCHDKAAGLECLQLANVANNVDCVNRILKDRYDPKYGDYYTPQLVASYLEGATPENAYKANKPFKINIRSHAAKKYEDSNSLKGTVLYLEVCSQGYDTNWRGISVVKQKGSPYYKVENNPSTYTQCKPVSFKIDDEYTDICKQ